MTDVFLGLDIGGTTTAAGLVTPAGEIVASVCVPTHHAGPGRALDTIAALVDALAARATREGRRLLGAGLGVPALVDAARGTVGPEVPHVPELAEQPLGPSLAARLGVPVVVDNDVNALALGEWRFGAARGARSLVVLAAGTGFGSGIVLEGRLLRGAGGFAGEFGHAPVRFDGPPCWCGGRGCLAVYASGRGVAEAARARLADAGGGGLRARAGGDAAALTAGLVFEAAAAGDPVAAAVVAEACRALGAMIAVLVNGLNPEVVLVTGGVAAGYAPLEARVLAAAADHALARALAATRVMIVPGDKRLGVRGAAALVLHERGGPGGDGEGADRGRIMAR